MNNKKLELSDLVSFYPERNDTNLQSIISSKNEFSELASLKNENVPQIQGELFNHQKFFGRFMRFYERGLVIDKPGTGKTCKVVTAMEWFQRNRGIIRKFFIIVPNKAVKHDVKKQIICMCDTDNRYKLPGLSEATTLAGQKSSASKGLSRYYLIFTHGEFARYLLKTYPDENQLRENQILTYGGKGEIEEGEFTGIAKQILLEFPEYKTKGPKKATLKGKALHNFIIDKVNKSPNKYKLNISDPRLKAKAQENYDKMIEEMSGSFYYLDEVQLLIPSKSSTNQDDLKQRLKQKYYNQIYQLFHVVKRSKIVLTTATPMTNSPDDIRPIINLLKNDDELLPENFDYFNSTIEEVNRYFGGYITYVAPVDNKVDVIYEGKDELHSIPLEGGKMHVDYIKAIRLPMSQFQEKRYNYYTQAEIGSAFRTNSLQASVFVFPDGSIGEAGLKKYTTRAKIEQTIGMSDDEYQKIKKTTVSWYKPTSEFSSHISNVENIRKLSVKCAEIIEYAIRDTEGVIYINIPYVEGGAIPFALCLEKVGFEIFTRRESVFETIGTKNKLAPYCPPRADSTTRRKVKDDFKKRGRCAIFSSEKIFPSTVNEAALEIVSSEENVNGDYVKIIIITPVGKVGISVNNVSKIFTVTPDWNESNDIQKEHRGIRATSHNARIKQLQQEVIEKAKFSGEELYQDQLDSIRIKLSIYRLAAISKEKSSDLDLYLMAKEKEIRIQNFFRKLMIVAVDCALNKDRNQMINYEDGSTECNYQACQYVCYGEGNWATDYSTYDIYYLGEIIESIIEKLIPIVKKNGVITYDKLFEEPSLQDIPHKHVIVALSELIGSKRGIKDRFGFTVYLVEKNGVIYFTREYPHNIDFDYSLYYYGKNLINIEFSDIDSTISFIEENVSDVIKTLVQFGIGTKPFFMDLNNKTLSVQANILELSLLNLEAGQHNKFDESIIDYYRGRWFSTHEPTKKIDEEIGKDIAKGNRGRPRTRKVKKFRVNRLTGKSELIKNDDDEIVYFHILYIDKEAPTQHGLIARQIKGEGRYRLYKPSEMMGWRDMDKYELAAYNLFVQNDRRKKEEQIKQSLVQSETQPIYGRMEGGELYIIDKSIEQPTIINGKENYHGKRCSEWTFHELIPVLYDLRIIIPPEYDQTINTDQAIQNIQDNLEKMHIDADPEDVPKWDPHMINIYTKWLTIAEQQDVNYLCPLIFRAMIEQGRLYKLPIYGRIIDGKLAIVDKTKEDQTKLNGRTEFKGKKCITWSKHELTPVLYELGIPLPPEYNYFIDTNQSIQIILFHFNKMELRGVNPDEVYLWHPNKIDIYAKWLMIADRQDHKYGKPKYLCPLITKAMIDQGRIVEF